MTHRACSLFAGLRCPAYAEGVNVPGYHGHMISEDRQIGGHVLGAEGGGA